jgi:hypothetical protein
MEATPITQIGVVLALFVAGMVKGTIGIGMPIVGLPLLAACVGVRPAAVLLSIPLLLSNVPQALEGGRTREALGNVAPLLIGAMPGIAAGVLLLEVLPPRSLHIFVGSMLLVVIALLILAPKLTIPRSTSRSLDVAVGFTSGVIGSPVAMPSNLVFTYFIAQGLRGALFTKHASLFVMCSSGWMALAFMATSTFDALDLLVSAICILPVLAGMRIGQSLRDKTDAKLFKWLVLATVFGAAVDLIRRGALDV